MNDWRIINEQENYWKGKSFLQIAFPEFWQRAYKTKNHFFQYVFAEAKQQVELLGQCAEYLEGDRCRGFWQRHCDFCNKSITTDTKEICYCSKDGLDWICAECFNDFKEKFGWTVLDNIQDIPAEGFIPLRATIASEKKTDEL